MSSTPGRGTAGLGPRQEPGRSWRSKAYVIAYTQSYLALLLARSADPVHHAEARQLALQILETEKMNLIHLAVAHLTLALVAALRLALVEACLAQGDEAQGETALRQALECVRLRASDIPDTVARERFLSQVPENARVRVLARQRWGTDVP